MSYCNSATRVTPPYLRGGIRFAEEIKVEPQYRNCLKITFDGLNGENIVKDKNMLRRVPLDLKVEEGRTYFEGANGEKVFTDTFSERFKDREFFDALKEALGERKWREFNDKVGALDQAEVYLTNEQILAAQAVTLEPATVEKFEEKQKALEAQGTWSKWLQDGISKLVEKYGDLALLAGATATTLAALGNNRKGCYAINLGSKRLIQKVSSSTSPSQCACLGRCDEGYNPGDPYSKCLSKPITSYTDTKMSQCDALCAGMPHYKQLLDWRECQATCSCKTKTASGKSYEDQPPAYQIGFQVVSGSVLSALGYLMSSVGYAITDIVEDGFKVVNTLANKLADFFKQWWVIAIIVVVALVVILVPTLVTQLPKKGGGVQGGGGWPPGGGGMLSTCSGW